MKLISREEELLLQEYLSYDPQTGHFYWIKRSGSNCRLDKPCGNVDTSGHLSITLRGQIYRLHRIAFLFMEEAIPECVDHVNRNPSDNRWSNLRGATRLQNSWNQGKPKNNTSGYKGVYFEKGRYRARVMVKGQRISLGSFKDIHDAVEAYEKACKHYYKDFYSARENS